MSEFFEVLIIGAVVTASIYWLSGIIARLFVLWIAWASVPTLVTSELRESGIIIQAREEIADHGIDATRIVALAIRNESAQSDPVAPVIASSPWRSEPAVAAAGQ